MTPFTRFSRAALARLGREYMLAAQFNSRTGYAALRMRHGDEAYQDIAIANWMGASPVYTRRMQRAMGFANDDGVATIFKGLQLECGFTHQYFDAHFALDSAGSGRFWLQRCGALLETEPRGEEAVRIMCHDIEDPTFDATAVATNPRAQVRPIHRPPRIPADRVPHCEWRVSIDPDNEPVAEHPLVALMAKTQLAQIGLARPPSSEHGGLPDYSGPLMEQLHLEQLSQDALVLVCAELAVQVQLLVATMMAAVSDRYGAESAAAIAGFQLAGSGWVVSERLLRWLPDPPSGLARIKSVLEVHPAFQPLAYSGMQLHQIHGDRLRLSLCPDAPAAQDEFGWQPMLRCGGVSDLCKLVQGVDRRARIEAVTDLIWDIVLSEGESSVDEEPLSVQIAKSTVLYQTKLQDRVQLLQL
ncbi:MAG: hypothetical protein AAGA91_06495 [Pseudomonadota bacterium]